MSVLKNKIDHEGLEEELEEALKEDSLYELRNKAKIRAIEQSVPTYEDFRQMVNGAHLKPLGPKDKMEKIKIPWNLSDRQAPSLLNKNINKSPSGEIKNSYCDKLSKNGKEFYCQWVQLNETDKFNLLYSKRNELPEIFKIELPVEILNEFLIICLNNLAGKNSAVIDILNKITQCNRFKLTVTFMSEDDKFICKQLFGKLIPDSSINFIELSDKFKINLN
ncbi:coiled-coil domain-containing protein 103 [Microplitis mediator]|uniref:coiled-coil domain-containing protein 103 n=1 Tax=Microplitis mediator TaxID=375433 RepID=UPI002555FD5B|nr:coiled-coil domain-containing protein 103 [Microplitis mediator]